MNRAAALDQLAAGERWDVLVVGGGATGLGAALDAATRGYRTLLLEQADFAQATSSRSTKLIHGGVRYLEQGNFTLVREALRERALLQRNAPDLVRVLPLIIPLQSFCQRVYMGAGLKLYDLLSARCGIGSSRHLSVGEMRERLPGFAGPSPRGGLLYFDGQFDDARLAIALARTAAAKGAAVLNYVRVAGLRKDGGRISGAVAEDRETGRTYEISARVVINATGVFADTMRRFDEPSASDSLAPSQGIHLVLPRSFLGGDTAILIPRTADGRVLFALPWRDRVLLGTTDTPVDQPELEPRARAEEVDFLLEHARRFLGWSIGRAEVLSVFAGLRPLVKAGGARTSRLARDHVITVSPAGLVSITGGKWTTYRLMAEQAVDAASRSAELPRRNSVTATLPLQIGGLDRIHDGNALLSDAAIREYAREEMARTVEDVLARRTRSLIEDARAARTEAGRVAAVLAAELGRDMVWRLEQERAFEALAEGYTL